MAIRFPKANTWFQKQTDTSLAVYAQNIHDGLVAAAATYPTPPVTAVALQALIDAYSAALTLAIGPGAGLNNTLAKDAAKLALLNALRQNCQYVNQVISAQIAGGTTYVDAQALIVASGYQLSADPTPAGPLGPVSVRKYGSFTKGQFYILIDKMVNAKGYVVRTIDLTPGGSAPYETTFPGTRMTLTGLVSGHEYTFQIAAIGANPTRDFSTQIANVFVI